MSAKMAPTHRLCRVLPDTDCVVLLRATRLLCPITFLRDRCSITPTPDARSCNINTSAYTSYESDARLFIVVSMKMKAFVIISVLSLFAKRGCDAS